MPIFPAIEQTEYAARTITPERLLRILAAIPWERRGVFLVIAFEQLRVSEAVAATLEDWDGEQLHMMIPTMTSGEPVVMAQASRASMSASLVPPFLPVLFKPHNSDSLGSLGPSFRVRM